MTEYVGAKAFDTPSAVAKIDTLAELKALDVTEWTEATFIDEASERAGTWRFKPTDQSVEVAADLGGEFTVVAPDSDATGASGAWHRIGEITTARADTVAELAGTSTVQHKTVILSDPAFGGTYMWEPVDLSAEVTADPTQGLYVAPDWDATGASGAWVRQFDGVDEDDMVSDTATRSPSQQSVRAYVDEQVGIEVARFHTGTITPTTDLLPALNAACAEAATGASAEHRGKVVINDAHTIDGVFTPPDFVDVDFGRNATRLANDTSRIMFPDQSHMTDFHVIVPDGFTGIACQKIADASGLDGQLQRISGFIDGATDRVGNLQNPGSTAFQMHATNVANSRSTFVDADLKISGFGTGVHFLTDADAAGWLNSHTFNIVAFNCMNTLHQQNLSASNEQSGNKFRIQNQPRTADSEYGRIILCEGTIRNNRYELDFAWDWEIEDGNNVEHPVSIEFGDGAERNIVLGSFDPATVQDRFSYGNDSNTLRPSSTQYMPITASGFYQPPSRDSGLMVGSQDNHLAYAQERFSVSGTGDVPAWNNTNWGRIFNPGSTLASAIISNLTAGTIDIDLGVGVDIGRLKVIGCEFAVGYEPPDFCEFYTSDDAVTWNVVELSTVHLGVRREGSIQTYKAGLGSASLSNFGGRYIRFAFENTVARDVRIATCYAMFRDAYDNGFAGAWLPQVMQSPNGSQWFVTVDDTGALTTTAV